MKHFKGFGSGFTELHAKLLFIFYLRIVGGGVQTWSTRHRGHLLPYCACPGWLWGWRIIRWNEHWQGKPKYSEKNCPSATLSTTNPTWPDPGIEPGPPWWEASDYPLKLWRGQRKTWCRHVALFCRPSQTKQNTKSKKQSCKNNACSQRGVTW
jgi:hypothetical protein